MSDAKRGASRLAKAPPKPPSLTRRIAPAGLTLVRRADPRLLATLIFAAIAVFGVFGEIHQNDYGSMFNLDEEGTPATNFSALLLLFAAAAALLAAETEIGRGAPRGILIGLGLFFAFMAIDEHQALHEKLEREAGIDWQILYVPVVLPAAAAGLLALRSLFRVHRLAAGLFAAGAAAWVLAIALEAYQWGGEGDFLLHPGTIVPEELLEMSGSALLALGLLVGIRRVDDARERSGASEASLAYGSE